MTTLYIAPGSPWKNRYNESYNGSLRNELLNCEIFYSLTESRALIEDWRRHLQHHPPAHQSRVSATGSGSCLTASAAFRFRCAPPPASTGSESANALTIKMEHSVGAGQSRAARYRHAHLASAAG